jgi:hypothetical protein
MKKEMESPIINESSRKHDGILVKKGETLFSAYPSEEGK